jgi:hypothetical protein
MLSANFARRILSLLDWGMVGMGVSVIMASARHNHFDFLGYVFGGAVL